MELFIRYKIIIFRVLGSLLFLIGFLVQFWSNPQEGVSENDKAAARVARMEASVKGQSSKEVVTKEPESSKFVKNIKNAQEKQAQYMTILFMTFGLGFLGYSFIKKEDG